MALIVREFGGSSVADAARVMNVARIVTDTYKAGNDFVVVVSAQGDTTDDLIAKAQEINKNPLQKEKWTSFDGRRTDFHFTFAMAIESLGFPCNLSSWMAGRL